MHRRTFLKGTASASAWAWFSSGPAVLASTAAPARFKLGAISDGFSQNLDEALTIMKSYGLSWVEIRNVDGVYNTEATPAQVRRMKQMIDQHGFRVSVIDSAFYKCELPGTTPVKAEKDMYPYSRQMDLLKRASERAHILGAQKIRGFTFWRVADPAPISKRIAAELEKAAEVARQEGMRLVIENEESCNAATGHELSKIFSLAPAANLGVNWDVGNGYAQGEISYPDGYDALDHKRVWHLHLKGMKCDVGVKNCEETFAGEGQIDLSGQLKRLLQDGYEGTMSLECEFKGSGLTHLETTKRSLEGLLRAVSAATGK